jgi:hypothetical protein
MGNEKTGVFEQLLIQRINRKLSADAKQLKTARSFQMETSAGRHFIVDLRRNSIERQQIDIEELGHELGVLAASEVLSSRVHARPCSIATPPQTLVRVGESARSK